MDSSHLKVEIAHNLRVASLFRYLTEEQLTFLELFGRVLTYKPRTIILSQGKQGNGLYLILNGKVDVRMHKLGEGTVKLAQIEAGHFFGEANLQETFRCTASVIACDEVTCFFLSRKCFESFSIGNPEIKYAIARALSEEIIKRYRSINKRIVNLLEQRRLGKQPLVSEPLREATSEAILFQSIPFVQKFNEGDLEVFLQKTFILKSQGPAFLLELDKVNSACFYVLKGALRANIIFDGKISPFLVHPPHTFICPISLIDRKSEIFSYLSCGKTEVLVLPKDYLDWVKKNHTCLWYSYYDLFCHYIFSLQRSLNTKIIRLAIENF